MTAFLPPEMRCSAYWYALRAGMVTDASDPGDLEFLRELGLRAAHLARWEGLPALTVPEGPWPAVYLWPERIWGAAAEAMANCPAEYGGHGPEDVRAPYARPGSPRPMVHDVLALDRRYGHSGRAAYEAQRRPGNSFWSYPPPPEDTQAYYDWCRMADEEGRILAGAYGPDEPILYRKHDAGWPPMSSEDR